MQYPESRVSLIFGCRLRLAKLAGMFEGRMLDRLFCYLMELVGKGFDGNCPVLEFQPIDIPAGYYHDRQSVCWICEFCVDYQHLICNCHAAISLSGKLLKIEVIVDIKLLP